MKRSPSMCLYVFIAWLWRHYATSPDIRAPVSSSSILGEEDDSLTLEVSDSGRGFDVEEAKRGGGLGLISAEERIKMLQGTFEVRSQPESGATLVARIPLGERHEPTKNSSR